MKFRIGQTVYSPFGVVKIIHRWKERGPDTEYDVKFIGPNRRPDRKDDSICTLTYSFREKELIPFSKGGVASNEDDAVKLIRVEEVDGEWIATFSVWVKIEIYGEIYSVEKEYKEKLTKDEN